MDSVKSLLGGKDEEEQSLWGEMNNYCSLTIQQVHNFVGFVVLCSDEKGCY